MTERKRPPRDWESSVERQIRDAMERGDFDGLPGNGKPLDLQPNPFTPSDWQLAFKILKDAGAAPEWVEQDKEIRSELQHLRMMLQGHIEWEREKRQSGLPLTIDQMILDHQRVTAARQETARRFQERAASLNKVIDTFNLKSPSSRLHHPRIGIEDELQAFMDACRSL